MKRIRYNIRVSSASFTVYSYIPINSDPDDGEVMAQMAEFITRANYGLRNGCFEMDFRDGEVRYKSYVDCEDQIPARAVIRNSIIVTANTVERYAKGILDVLFCGTTAKEAIERCES